MSRETLKGNVSVGWLALADAPATLAAIAVATEYDVDAIDLLGTKGGEALFEHSGFEPSLSTINTPDYISNETGSLVGEITYGAAVMRYYWDDTVRPVWDLLPIGTQGYLVFGQSGSAVGNEYIIHPCDVALRDHDMDGSNVASSYTLTFSRSAPTRGIFVT
jgi:hypothetical protein